MKRNRFHLFLHFLVSFFVLNERNLQVFLFIRDGCKCVCCKMDFLTIVFVLTKMVNGLLSTQEKERTIILFSHRLLSALSATIWFYLHLKIDSRYQNRMLLSMLHLRPDELRPIKSPHSINRPKNYIGIM